MPFPKRDIKFCRCFGTSSRAKYVVNENGQSVEILQDCNKSLPAAKLFKIANQIAAGVTLKEVPTKVISNIKGATVEGEVADIVATEKKRRGRKPKNVEPTIEVTDEKS